MMRFWMRGGVGLIVFVGALSAACVDNDEPETATRPEFIRRADALCRASASDPANDRGSTVTVRLDDPPARLDSFAVNEGRLDEARELVRELRRLRPPAEDRREIDTLLDRFDEAPDDVEALLDAGDEDERVDLGQRILQRAEEIDRAAERYGFEVCGRLTRPR